MLKLLYLIARIRFGKWKNRCKSELDINRRLKDLEGELSRENLAVELPRYLKQKIVDEILHRLRSLNSSGIDIAKEREVVESWRNEKLKEVKLVNVNRTSNSSIPIEEAGMLLRALGFVCEFEGGGEVFHSLPFPSKLANKALESDWEVVCEEIGLWIPAQVVNEEHDDKPEGTEDFEEEILPGRPLPPECRAELHTDYDDIYQHKHQECWLKYAAEPRLNFKDKYPQSYKKSFPSAPRVVPWVSGVVSS
ncbi:hypothetical protein P8452_22881 [Trifolium repens]|nr:hypothetical protein P8452_22881 [Trifolium repens]